MKKIDIVFNFNNAKKEFKKPWELCIGSDHAYTLLREDCREHYKTLHDECGFEFIRFHGIFNDDMQVVNRDYKGKLVFSFFNIDSIFDYLLKNGMKPFIELSFMPSVLASDITKTVMHYKGIVSLPKDMNEWNYFIETFVKHLIARYGKKEVESWYFEHWNEPNLGGDIINFNTGFFAGTMQQYFDFYKNTVLSIKKVDKNIRCGGPATSNNRFIKEFKNYCITHNVPFDFVSTHHYPTDVLFGDNETKTKELLRIEEDLKKAKNKEKAMKELYAFRENIWKYVDRGVCKIMDLKAREEAGDTPLFYTEWQSLAGIYADGQFGSSFNTKTVLDSKDIVDGYSFWTGSDVFEEDFQPSKEFCGQFGLITFHGIKKVTFNAFKLLHKINGKVLEEMFANDTLDGYFIEGKDNTDYVLLINHNSISHPIFATNGQIKIENYPGKIVKINEYICDKNHSNSLTYYKDNYDGIDYLSDEQIADIKKHDSLFKVKYNKFKMNENELNITYCIKAQSVILFEIIHI